MFENLTDVFKTAYNLARTRRIQYDKDVSLHSFRSSDSIDVNEKKRQKSVLISKPLDDYLNTLDFETVKILQTIMYLGRDDEYNTLSNGEERYKRLRDSLDKNKGWTTKDIEIDQMTGKVPLDEYLHKGFEILGIRF